MALTIKNNSKKDVVIQHFSGQKYDFVLLDDKKKNCTGGLETEHLLRF